MNYEIQDITYDDIRRASDNWLRAWLKEDLDPEIHDMVDKELYVREQRREIVPGTEYIIKIQPPGDTWISGTGSRLRPCFSFIIGV